jgi:PLP dependent protein
VESQVERARIKSATVEKAGFAREVFNETGICHFAGGTVTTTDSLAARYQEVLQRIDAAAKRDHRSGTSVILVAVSKYADIDDIRALAAMGHKDFGENLVQSLMQRSAMIAEWMARHKSLPQTRLSASTTDTSIAPNSGLRWHMIGHLQRNKARKAVECARLVHSVDSLRVAEEIQHAANRLGTVCEVLVQVNTSGEESKFGCAPAATVHLIEQITSMINVRVRGLMTMAPYSDNPQDARPAFSRLRELFEELKKAGDAGIDKNFNILSMGMSGDYEVAIEEGANLVRVGSALFGDHAKGAQGADKADGLGGNGPIGQDDDNLGQDSADD